MPSRAWLKGQEIAEEERQMQLQNEAFDRAFKRGQIACAIAHERFAMDRDDIEVLSPGDAQYVDGGYWVDARIFVDADEVEERMS